MLEIVPSSPSGEIVTVEGGEVVLRHDGSAPEVMRKRIDALVADMFAASGDHVEFRVEHEFVDGMYLRKLFIPKGGFLAGKVHRKACMNIVAYGDITVLTEFGCQRLTAGWSAVSRPGTRKVGYAHEDTVFINVFRSDTEDLSEIESECVERDQVELIGSAEEIQCLG